MLANASEPRVNVNVSLSDNDSGVSSDPKGKSSSSTDKLIGLASCGPAPSVIAIVWLSLATSPSPSVTWTLKVTLCAVSWSKPVFGSKVQVPSFATFKVPSVRAMSAPMAYSVTPISTIVAAAPSAPALASSHVPSIVPIASSATVAVPLTVMAGTSSTIWTLNVPDVKSPSVSVRFTVRFSNMLSSPAVLCVSLSSSV